MNFYSTLIASHFLEISNLHYKFFLRTYSNKHNHLLHHSSNGINIMLVCKLLWKGYTQIDH